MNRLPILAVCFALLLGILQASASSDLQDQSQLDVDERTASESTRVNPRMMKLAVKRDGGPPHNRWGGILGKRNY